jgi:AcrR family transcriptional regulator
MDETDGGRRPPFAQSPLVGERGANTRRSILDAALTVFGERGYHDTRVELITEAAGCSRPAFYQYFSSKEEIFWALTRHMGIAMGQAAGELGAVGRDQDGVRRLREWLDGLVELCTTYASLLTELQTARREQVPTADGSHDPSAQLGEALLRNIDATRAAVDIAALSTVTASVVLRSIDYWRLGVGGLDRGPFVDGLAQTIHRLLHGVVPRVNAPTLHPSASTPAPEWLDPPLVGPDRPLRPRGEQTRKRLLDAASSILPALGYHAIRIDDIVEAAGVSHGSFYRYFDSKAVVFQMLFADAATRMVDLLAVFPGTTTDATLLAWLRSWFSTYRDNGGILSAWEEIGSGDPLLTAFSVEIAVTAFDQLVRIVGARDFGDPLVDAIVLLSVIERAPYNVLVLADVDEQHAIDASALIVRRALFGAEVA